jgi:MoaA/NifB/PqqE/SkfB family radical SAM enzyme
MTPKVCNYYVTLRCNDTCEFCSIWQEEKFKQIEEKPYDLALLKNIKVKHLNITGGEPLLREDLPHILKQAKELGFKTELTTNGILYPEKARWLEGMIDRLHFSLDYPIAEEHDRSRGVECFHLVIKSIKLAQEHGAKPIINFTLTRDNVRFLPEMVELAEKLKVLVYFNPVYDFYGTQGFEDATLSHIRYYFRTRNVLLNLAVLEFMKNSGNKVILPRCKARETTLTLMPDGSRVSPCFFNPGGKQGREYICSSCTRWPYMLPSFSKGFDKYFWLNFYSEVDAWRKGVRT